MDHGDDNMSRTLTSVINLSVQCRVSGLMPSTATNLQRLVPLCASQRKRASELDYFPKQSRRHEEAFR